MGNIRKQKALLVVLIVVLLIFTSSLLIFKNFTGFAVKNNEKIKIGSILPLTGSAGFFGNQIRQGIDLAHNELTSIETSISYEDSGCDPKQGVSAYNKLVHVEGVEILVGDVCSSVVLSIAPLAEKDKVLLLTPGAAASEISFAGDYIFRNHVTMAQKTGLLAEFASNKYETVAIIYDSSNEAFVEGKEVFKKANEGKVVAIESFQRGDNDFKTQLTKIKAKNPEAIYIGSLSLELTILVKQIRELNIESQILSDDAGLDPAFLDSVGSLADGIIFSTADFSKESSPEFWNDFNSHFNQDPSVFSAQGYDSMKIIGSIIIETCHNGDPTCIKEELYKIKDYYGASGKTSFDSNGDALKELVLKKIVDGKFILYEE
jgi:branched-chain amino acid transport system substrate-binding protein